MAINAKKNAAAKTINIAARKSALAQIQALTVGESLARHFSPLETHFHFHFRDSLGDKNLTTPLWQAPEKGVFTEDFYQDLVSGKTDLVVHSWKDLPIVEKEKTFICATLPRADQRDILLIKKSHLSRIQEQKCLHLFSSSPRRAYNLRDFAEHYFPWPIKKTEFEPVRGNIATRIQKLFDTESIDGLLVAKAALDRLLTAPWPEFQTSREFLRKKLEALQWMILPLSINPTAAAQGALAIEVRRDRDDLIPLLEKINDRETFACVTEERRILQNYGGGCHQAIGVSVLRRDFGELTFLRGKTETGELLRKESLTPKLTARSSSPTPTQNSQWLDLKGCVPSEEFFVAHRKSLLPVAMPPVKTADAGPRISPGLWVAKSSAWPDEWTATSQDFLIWTAGLQTWKKLAQRGVWVHGSADGLGEEELATTTNLGKEPVQWTKLTHQDSRETTSRETNTHASEKTSREASEKTNAEITEVTSKWPMTVLATYQLQWNWQPQAGDQDTMTRFDHFFWTSASLFKTALEREPEIINKIHCCGPGLTAKYLERVLRQKGLAPTEHLAIFLNQTEWRRSWTS